MRFQQYTSFDESKDLKELGAAQTLKHGDWFWDANDVDLSDLRLRLVVDSDRLGWPEAWEKSKTNYGRAYTLQEMLHMLMEHYQVDLLVQPRASTVWLFDRKVEGDILGSFTTDGDARDRDTTDPFRAVFEAFKWHLRNQST